MENLCTENLIIYFSINGTIIIAKQSTKRKDFTMTRNTNTRTIRTNAKGEKLYPISGAKNQHNFQLVSDIMFNRAYDAEQAGDMAAYNRLMERKNRADNYFLMVGAGVGWFTGKEYADAMAMINWAKTHRAIKCEERNIPYVE